MKSGYRISDFGSSGRRGGFSRPAGPRAAIRKPAMGFTLIEILAVVVIVGIAAAIVVPRIGSRDDLNAAAAARVIMSDLIWAQNRAIATQQVQYVRFNTTGDGQYAVLSGVSPEVIQTHPVNKTSYAVIFGEAGTPQMESIRLTAASFDSKTILAFDALGEPYACASTGSRTALSSAGQIKISSGSYNLTIQIEPYSGEISVK